MKKIARISMFGLILIFFYACSKNVPVYNVSKTNPPDKGKGFFYALPKTMISTDFVICRTEITKAKYGEFAESMIGEKNEPEVVFKIEEVSITNVAAVDSTQWYFVDLHKNGMFKKVSITAETNETGIISNGSAETDNKSVEYVADFVEFAGGVASKFIPISNFGASSKGHEMSAKSMTYEKVVPLVKTMTKKDSAEQVVIEIRKIREQHMQLISNQTGTAVTEGTLQLMLKELDNKEEQLLSLFLGEKKVKKIKLHFRTSNIADQNLFLFSTTEGLSGFPSSMNVESKFVNTKGDGDPIILKFLSQSKLPPSMMVPPVPNESSFYYRIPVNADVQVWKKAKIIYETEFPIAQMGTVKSLPLKSGSMKSKYELKYDPKTGALLKITISGDPVSSDAIDKAKTAGNQVLELVKPDQLSELEKERKILEEQKKILDLQKELNTDN